jgi:hypothetical protein
MRDFLAPSPVGLSTRHVMPHVVLALDLQAWLGDAGREVTVMLIRVVGVLALCLRFEEPQPFGSDAFHQRLAQRVIFEHAKA